MQTVDPVGSGYVESMSRPGGDTTGFTQFEYSLSGKWLELLKQIVPQVARVAVIRDPVNGSGIAQFAVIQAFAPPLGVEAIPIDARDLREMERSITGFRTRRQRGSDCDLGRNWLSSGCNYSACGAASVTCGLSFCADYAAEAV